MNLAARAPTRVTRTPVPQADRFDVVSRLLRLRYASTCSVCRIELSRGTEAYWDGGQKIVTCVGCLEPATVMTALDRGRAGGSAAREWHRRHDKRETRVREQYGKLGGLVLAVTEDPHSTKAWAYGANGESALGKLLDPLRGVGIAVLHDRRIPGSRANIDHVVIAPAGVFVIDAKNYKGKVERRDRGGFFSVDDRLYVGNRDRTRLVLGMAPQAEAVRRALGTDVTGIRISQVICFVAAEWPLLFARPLQFGEVSVLWPDELTKRLRADGQLGPDQIALIERHLALALPAAA